jgi:hypothetical protein
MRIRFAANLLAVACCATAAFADRIPAGNAATAINIPLQVTVTAATTTLSGNANPSNPTLACNTAPGTVISKITTSGGDGNPVALAFAPGSDASYALSAQTSPANVVVGTNGIVAADCGITTNYTITATQN